MATISHIPSLIFSLGVLLLLDALSSSSALASSMAPPPNCMRIECPNYDVVEEGNDYEIRLFNSSVWMSTSKIDDISFVDGTLTGFLQLFDYIQGKNKYGEKIEMTAPVITEVSPSDGPFCASSFTVSFYVPKENQADPPPAEGLHLQKWNMKYAAVRRFGGFVDDSMVGREAAALEASLVGTSWYSSVKKGRDSDSPSLYTVAQYNSPFEFEGRVNEIWMTFELEGGRSI